MKGQSLTSIGVDIGTTTTHMVVSRLHYGNLALPTQITRLGIIDKEILFSSTIHRTPLTDSGIIDADAVARLLDSLYQEANFSNPLIQIDTGAVIITGESAAKRNAEEVCRAVARLAGDFVVESAGAALESIFCARGSGAQERSKLDGTTLVSIDIGGGTSNFALIVRGEIMQVDVINIGGKAITFENGAIATFSDYAEAIIGRENIDLKIGDKTDEVEEILNVLAEILAKEIFLILKKISQEKKLHEVIFSGGVAALIEKLPLQMAETSSAQPLTNIYDDFGVYLAPSLYKVLKEENSAITFSVAKDAIRATVLGAGMHALQLTGSTIGCPDDGLPLRNVPIIKVDLKDFFREDLPKSITIDIQKAMRLREIDWSKQTIALALTGMNSGDLQYLKLKKLADELAHCATQLSAANPLVIVLEHDVAMALNQLLKRSLPDKTIITVDGITALDGDYLDIGKPVNSLSDPNTRTLPVVVKTLVFYKK